MKTTLIILRAMAIAILLIVFCLGLISFTAEAETGISQLLWTGGWMLVVVLSAKGLERLGAIKDDTDTKHGQQ